VTQAVDTAADAAKGFRRHLTGKNLALAGLGTAALGTGAYLLGQRKAAAADEPSYAESAARGGVALGAAGAAGGYGLGKGIQAADKRVMADPVAKKKYLADLAREGISDSTRAKALKKAPGMLTRRMGAAGAMAGTLGGLGYAAMNRKQASVAEYSVLFDKVASGELGEGPRQALYGICQAVEAPQLSEKTASVYDASNLTEEDARKARLDQLLKR
jgi:hypothetical protein